MTARLHADLRPFRAGLLAALGGWTLLSSARGNEAAPAPAPVSYSREVMAVISKGGCNTGQCHGSANGKGGFRLSLWGDEPGKDHAALADKKRLRRDKPEESALLRKPTLAEDHDGGRRFDLDSESYRLLARWIAEGAKNDTATAARVRDLRVEPAMAVQDWPGEGVRLRVLATFTDGSEQDVTPWAVYEPATMAAEVSAGGVVAARAPHETLVRVRYLEGRAAARLAFVPGRTEWTEAETSPSFIDRFVSEKLRLLGIPPSPLADDATFLRRAHLDLTGLIPAAEEVRRFLADPAPDKRSLAVDELLGRSAFADFWAMQWADLLRVEEVVLDSTGVKAFHGWIRDAMLQNKPLDAFASEILSARGSTYQNPPANYWRALRAPPQRAEAVAQVFLGVRLQCAQCHNHPFDRWTQDDYYHLAGLLAGLTYDIKENKREDENDKNRFNGEQIVKVSRESDWKDPRTGKPAVARIPDPAAPAMDEESDPLEALARWITTQSPLFPRTQANRIWYRLMGRGLIDPVDDVRDSNPASHPALLDALAAELVASGYDQKKLIRTIMLSRAYQRSALPVAGNAWDEVNLSHATVRRLGAEQLLDSLHRFLGLTARFEGYDAPLRAAEIPGIRAVYKKGKPTPCDQFLTQFGRPPRLTNSDQERANDTALGQVFTLVSGPDLHRWLRDKDNRFDAWIGESATPAELLERLYLSSIGRPPAPPEQDALLPLLAQADTRRRAVEDIAWGLINSKEFLFRH